MITLPDLKMKTCSRGCFKKLFEFYKLIFTEIPTDTALSKFDLLTNFRSSIDLAINNYCDIPSNVFSCQRGPFFGSLIREG